MRLIAILAILNIVWIISCGRSPNASGKSAQEVAEAQLKGLSHNSQWKLLGLNSSTDLSTAQLEPPAPVYFVRADELSKYKGGDLREIVHDTSNLIFPVTVGGRGRILIEVGRRQGKWIPIRDGYQDSAAAFVASRSSTNADSAGRAAMFVKIGAMNESTLLISGEAQEAQPAAPGSDNVNPNVKSVNLNASATTIIPLNQAAKAMSSQDFISSRSTSAISGKASHAYAASGGKRRGSASSASSAPGASPPLSPAKNFFRQIAPAAQQALTQQSGPGR